MNTLVAHPALKSKHMTFRSTSMLGPTISLEMAAALAPFVGTPRCERKVFVIFP